MGEVVWDVEDVFLSGVIVFLFKIMLYNDYMFMIKVMVIYIGCFGSVFVVFGGIN